MIITSKSYVKKQMSVKGKKEDIHFVKEVLDFYKKHGRHNLLWRKKINPYRILVSEIMLQQTQVTRVIPKFESWMNVYPNLHALSKSTLKDVLILWQGLGYQRRAKALLEISKSIHRLPKRFEELLLLQGIGPYTASAITAFAHDTFSHPVLETNIRTVLIEYFHSGEIEIHDGVLKDDLSRLEKYKEVKEVGARHFYYALMDMGAHLKANKISHNKKSKHHTTQSAFKGSLRQLRAKTLFAITHGDRLPDDERREEAIAQLLDEGFVKKKGRKYSIA